MAKAKKRKSKKAPVLTPEQKVERAARTKAEYEARKKREAEIKRKAKEKLLASTRSYCAACGGKLACKQSKQIALCRRCFSHCPRCGHRTNTVGHYDICMRCVTEVATAMQRYDEGHSPATAVMPWDEKPTPAPKEVSICECCGDEGEFVCGGRMLCAECRSELQRVEAENRGEAEAQLEGGGR